MMENFTPDDFTRPRNPPPPPDWWWSGWRSDGTAQIEMRGILAGVKVTKKTISPALDARLHIIISQRKGCRISEWAPHPAGGLITTTHGGGAVRQLHLDLSRFCASRLERDKQIEKMKRAVGRRIILHAIAVQHDYKEAGDTDEEAEFINDLLNFQGFDVGIQCPLCRPTHIYIEPSGWEKLKDYFGFA